MASWRSRGIVAPVNVGAIAGPASSSDEMTAGLLCFHIPAAIIEPLLKRNDKLVGWQAIGCWLAINIALSVANLVWVWRRIEGVDGPVGLEVFIPLLLGVAFAGVSVFQPFLSAVFLSRWRPESESPTIHAVWGSCAGILALLPLCLIAAAAWVLCF